MKNLCKNNSKPVRIILLFALIYSVLVTPLNPGYHSHNDDSAVEENATGIITAVLEAPADHVHFDEQPVPIEHQHKHEFKITRNSVKTQIRQISEDNDKYTTPLYIILYCKNQASFIWYSRLLYITEHDDSSFIVRGPPFPV